MKKIFFSLCAVLLSVWNIAAQTNNTTEPNSTPILVSISDTTCEGHAYNFNGHLVFDAGIYRDTSFSFREMRDSITVLNLHVKPASHYRYSDVIVHGESYVFEDTVLTTEGVYTRYHQAANGCDSIVYFQLGILFPPCDTIRSVQQATICEGEEYLFCGRILTEPGTYIDTIRRADNSCDSIATLTLIVNPTSSATVETAMYTDESYTLTSGWVDTTFTHTIPGIYEHTVISTNQYGCDSTISISIRTFDRIISQEIPTMFSPYEGIRDVFLRGRDIELYIYDRYGLLISHNKAGDGWDGTYKGKFVDPGVYVYVAKLSDGTVKKGTIEVIKE